MGDGVLRVGRLGPFSSQYPTAPFARRRRETIYNKQLNSFIYGNVDWP
jgi:hypothetical protein